MKTEILESPWKHAVIDDLLSNEEYEVILSYIKSVYDFSRKYGYKEIHKHNSNSVISNIMCPKILLLKDLYLNDLNYANKQIPEIYYPYVELVIVPPKFKYFRIHTDDSFKIMSTVLYFYPKKSSGTELYHSETQNSFHNSIEWKENRALCFVSQENDRFPKTWHNYSNNTNDIRITFNLVLSTVERPHAAALRSPNL